MPAKKSILLSGSTGFLGGRLLCELLAAGHQVVVLARDKKGKSAQARIWDQIDFWSDSLAAQLPKPVVIACDFREPGADLGALDIQFIGSNCATVIHSAASLSFRANSRGEPWQTNVGGTENLLSACRRAGISEWHQISTAFVCGRADSRVFPEEAAGPEACLGRNAYEESKARAESIVRAAPGFRATIYRPSIIVGDSRTGQTNSFSGLYRVLEIGLQVGLQGREYGDQGPARIPLRLPLAGTESWNLVPVDWVAKAICSVVENHKLQGRIYHLVSPRPVTAKDLLRIGSEVLGVVGVELASEADGRAPSALEKSFLDSCREFWPYLSSGPTFDVTDTAALLSGLPCPWFDDDGLRILFQYARDHKWRQMLADDHSPVPASKSHPKTCNSSDSYVSRLVEQVLPEIAARVDLCRHLNREFSFQLNIHGRDGGQWLVRLGKDSPVVVSPIQGQPIPDLVFGMEKNTFLALAAGKATPQAAFFQRKIKVSGDLERGLLLGTLFGQLVRATGPIPMAAKNQSSVAPL